MQYRLSILMPGLQSRAADCRVKNQILSQMTSEVEFIELIDSGEKSSGLKRQELSDLAQGKYLAFVDDDDTVSSDYIKKLLSAISEEPDLVTFNMEARFRYYKKSTLRKEEVEIWELGYQEDDRKSSKLGPNHLCAWKKEITQKISWCPFLGCGDDQLWYKPLLMSGLVNNELHLDEVLYYYHWSSLGTSNQTNARVDAAKAYFCNGLRCFSDGEGNILIEHSRTYRSPEIALVRDHRNVIKKINIKEYKYLGLVKFV